MDGLVLSFAGGQKRAKKRPITSDKPINKQHKPKNEK